MGFNWVFVIVNYPGANPDEVENLVAIPVEDEMQSVDDVDVIVSRSRRGNAFVWLRFEQISDDDFERRADDVRARIPKIDLPDGAEDPIVQEFSSYSFQPVISVVARGSAPERMLHTTSPATSPKTCATSTESTTSRSPATASAKSWWSATP